MESDDDRPGFPQPGLRSTGGFVTATEGLSRQELAARLGLDPTIVVGLVDGLEDRGLLVRSKDPEDRRRNVLTLTRAGSALRTKAIRSVRTIEDGFLAPLPYVQRANLRTVFHAVLAPGWPGSTERPNR